MATTDKAPIILPWDEHNRNLAAQVHPADWQNPTPAPRYNLVVVGAGTAGLVSAAGAAGLGAKVALVERHLMGGDCLNVGCVPSKTLIGAARAAAAVRDAADFGVRVPEGVHVDFGRVMERMRRLRASIARNDSVERFSRLGVDVFIGSGRFVDSHTLEAAGVAYSAKGIQVNDRLQTTQPDIFAAGDICSSYQFTHAADFIARTVIRNALFFGRAKASALTIPWCTYTEPEIAHVGLYPQQAAAQGIALDTFTRELGEVDRAVLEGRTQGFVRVHVRKGSDRIAGATIVAPTAGEMISAITLAMTNGLGLKQIAAAIHPYPTLAEAVRQVADAYNRTRLTPFTRRLFTRWMAWRR